MTRDELLMKLAEYETHRDEETCHYEADEALLAYIVDAEITEAYNRLTRWYA